MILKLKTKTLKVKFVLILGGLNKGRLTQNYQNNNLK